MPWTMLLWDGAIEGLLLSAAMTCAWAIQQRSGNSSWIDFGWTTSVALAAAGGALFGAGTEGVDVRRLVVAALIACWGFRLGGHLLGRALRGVDDPRYAALAKQWGAAAPRRMFWFVQSQAVAGMPLVLAVVLAAGRLGAWPSWQDGLGTVTIAAAIAGAGLSDAQLRGFAASPFNHGKVCDRGFWRWSRHPNYFFEWLGWVGFALIALPLAGGGSVGWFALLAPLEMYGLLVYVSGIPPLEAHMAHSRPLAWARYRDTTSAFFPWPPRR